MQIYLLQKLAQQSRQFIKFTELTRNQVKPIQKHHNNPLVNQSLFFSFTSAQQMLSLSHQSSHFLNMILNKEQESPEKKALSFVKNQCLSEQFFQSKISTTGSFEDPTQIRDPKSEVFSSIIILDLLIQFNLEKSFISPIAEFVQSSLKEDGTINFFKDPSLKKLFPNDVDCSAFGMSVLIKSGIVLPEKIQELASTIIKNVDQDGIIQVYFPPRESREGRLDPAFCANALYFLNQIGRGDEAKKTEDYLYAVLEKKEYLQGTRYYPSPDAFLYFIARMMQSSERIRDRFEPLLRRRIEERIGISNGLLECAFRLIISNQLDIHNKADRDTLLASQNVQGGFPAETFFRCGKHPVFFGSAAITSSFALAGLDVQPTYDSFIPIDTLYYPFLLHKKSLKKVETSLKRELLDWYHTYHIFPEKIREKYADLINTYTKNCSPENISYEELKLSNQFLTIYFVLNDTFSKNPTQDKSLLYVINSILSGAFLGFQDPSQQKQWEGFIKATKEFRKQIVQRSIWNHKDIDRFSESFKNFTTTSIKECSFFGQEEFLTLKEYHLNRLENIFVHQHLELWNILLKDFISDALRETLVFDKQLERVATLIYLSNDLKSLERDQALSKPSYPILLAKEMSISLDDARKKTLVLHREILLQFINEDNKCLYNPEFLSIGYAVASQFFKICLLGNLTSMKQFPERYGA